MIHDEAIEAAAEALVGSTLGDRSGINWDEFFEAARAALEAAAPYLMAQAWDEAVSEGESCGWVHEYAADDLGKRNPYRSQS